MNFSLKLAISASLSLSLGLATGAYSQESEGEKGILTQKRAYKGYPKRNRLMPRGYSNYYSPSQAHEVYGFQGGAAAKISNIEVEKEGGFDTKYVIPGATVKAFWGGDYLVLGLSGDFTNFNSNPDGDAVTEEFYNVYQVEPTAALTISDSFTVGIASKFTLSDLEVNEPNGVGEAESVDNVTNRYNVTTYGASYHTPKWEAGLAYAHMAKDSQTFAKNNDIENNIYIPSNTTLFVRGNLVDSFSVLAATSYVEYERTATGSIETFSKYRLEDRLAGRLQMSYWTKQRDRMSVTFKHTPATYIGAFVSGMDYVNIAREANLYGVDLDLVKAFDNKKSSFGILAGFERGERDQWVDGVRYVSREERVSVAGSLNIVM